MCATACFDIGYKVSDICDDEDDTAQEKCQRSLQCLCLQRMSGVV